MFRFLDCIIEKHFSYFTIMVNIFLDPEIYFKLRNEFLNLKIYYVFLDYIIYNMFLECVVKKYFFMYNLKCI